MRKNNTASPHVEWLHSNPKEAGFSPTKLANARAELDAQQRDYRVVIVRDGKLVAEWNRGLAADNQQRLASATKSIFSNMLGIAVAEGLIESPDVKLVDLYPEALDVPADAGPKPGRYVFPKDRAITLRQLISNTSGYMKPDEEPGQVFHYQTYGMNVFSKAIAKAYGLYNSADPEGSPGFKTLAQSKLAEPIGADRGYYQANFDLQASARLNIFGYFDGVQSTALDMARLGWLWCNWGRWGDRQVIPEAWLRESTQTAPDILANCPEAQWCYGYGFWTNDHGKLWPNLPRDSFAASGAGSQHIWVWPAQSLVIVQSPGLWKDQGENDTGLIARVVDAME